jgi:hypothetical protein
MPMPQKQDNKPNFFFFFLSLFFDTPDFPNRNNILLSPYFKIPYFCTCKIRGEQI